MPVLDNGFGQLTLDIAFKTPQTPIRLWTGDGNLTFGGKTFSPSKLLGIGENHISLGAPQTLPYFEMALTQNADRIKFFNQDPGPLATTIQFIWSVDGQTGWRLAFTIEGRLSES